jgi:HAD superfamily hydrolase (TIGR01490 family)
MQPSAQTVVFFDFDGTLIRKDSLVIYIGWRLRHSWRAIGVLPCVLWNVLLFKLNLRSDQKAKQSLLKLLTGKCTRQQWLRLSHLLAQKLVQYPHPITEQRLQYHLKQGHRIIIVTASPADWIRAWVQLRQLPIEVVGTEMETIGDQLSFRFATPNCRGKEKVHRLRKLLPHWEQLTTYGYGDSAGDLYFLHHVTYAYYRDFSQPTSTLPTKE